MLLAVMIVGLGITVGMTRLEGGTVPVYPVPPAEHFVPPVRAPVAAPAPATLDNPDSPLTPNTTGAQGLPADGAIEVATEPGTRALPAAWCKGPMPLQAMARVGAGRLIPLPVDPVRCTLQLDGRRDDGVDFEAISDVFLYQPGFRPEGVRLVDIGPDDQGWPEPTPLEGPLIGCPEETGLSVAQVESAAGVEPLDRLCVGLCVPVAPLLADPERCSAAAGVVAQLSELPLLWDLVSLRGRPGAR